MGDIRPCPKSCGTVTKTKRTLTNRPEIISIGLVWNSDRPSLDHIIEVISTIGTTLRLSDVFTTTPSSEPCLQHHLVGIVTYYGKHYTTFFFHTKLRVWIYFDDATVKEIGPYWEQVVEKCRKDRYQPLLLLYALPDGTPIDIESVPKDVVNYYATTNPEKSTIIRRSITPSPEKPKLCNSVTARRAITPSGEQMGGRYVGDYQNLSVIQKAITASVHRTLSNGSSSSEICQNGVRIRRDSGNWSASTGSSSNGTTANNNINDPGYDSYSLSSNDSSGVTTLQHLMKMGHLAQIPEDYSGNKGIQSSEMSPVSCDVLCNEADELLAKSRRLEDEHDLVLALALCNAAATKARAAMNAPYNNQQTLTAARMKHNTCIMRARSLHRRMTNNNGSLTNGESNVDIRHTREGSSSNSANNGSGPARHSRQNSRDKTARQKHTTTEEPTTKKCTNIEIYATLPRNSKKTAASAKLSSKPVDNSNTATDIDADTNKRQSRAKSILFGGKSKRSRSEDRKRINDNLSITPVVIDTATLTQNDNIDSSADNNKKQHKIRRKLLMGGLLKRKNRSLPDLTDDVLDINPKQDYPTTTCDEISLTSPNLARSKLMRKKLLRNNIVTKVPPPPPMRTTSQLTTPELTTAITTPYDEGPIYRNLPIVNVEHEELPPYPSPAASAIHSRQSSQDFPPPPTPLDLSALEECLPSSNSWLRELQAKQASLKCQKPANADVTCDVDTVDGRDEVNTQRYPPNSVKSLASRFEEVCDSDKRFANADRRSYDVTDSIDLTTKNRRVSERPLSQTIPSLRPMEAVISDRRPMDPITSERLSSDFVSPEVRTSDPLTSNRCHIDTNTVSDICPTDSTRRPIGIVGSEKNLIHNKMYDVRPTSSDWRPTNSCLNDNAAFDKRHSDLITSSTRPNDFVAIDRRTNNLVVSNKHHTDRVGPSADLILSDKRPSDSIAFKRQSNESPMYIKHPSEPMIPTRGPIDFQNSDRRPNEVSRALSTAKSPVDFLSADIRPIELLATDNCPRTVQPRNTPIDKWFLEQSRPMSAVRGPIDSSKHIVDFVPADRRPIDITTATKHMQPGIVDMGPIEAETIHRRPIDPVAVDRRPINPICPIDVGPIDARQLEAQEIREVELLNAQIARRQQEVKESHKTCTKKKSVSFCDQVILVATADEDEDDSYIPNPILERVLRENAVPKSDGLLDHDNPVLHYGRRRDSVEDLLKNGQSDSQYAGQCEYQRFTGQNVTQKLQTYPQNFDGQSESQYAGQNVPQRPQVYEESESQNFAGQRETQYAGQCDSRFISQNVLQGPQFYGQNGSQNFAGESQRLTNYSAGQYFPVQTEPQRVESHASQTESQRVNSYVDESQRLQNYYGQNYHRQNSCGQIESQNVRYQVGQSESQRVQNLDGRPESHNFIGPHDSQRFNDVGQFVSQSNFGQNEAQRLNQLGQIDSRRFEHVARVQNYPGQCEQQRINHIGQSDSQNGCYYNGQNQTPIYGQFNGHCGQNGVMYGHSVQNGGYLGQNDHFNGQSRHYNEEYVPKSGPNVHYNGEFAINSRPSDSNRALYGQYSHVDARRTLSSSPIVRPASHQPQDGIYVSRIPPVVPKAVVTPIVVNNAHNSVPTDRTKCNLCRKKNVAAANLYCVDCEFYMSRFKPKN